jgi:hypothetical protein
MAMDTAHDLPIANKPTGDDTQSDSEADSAALATSSPTLAATKMADRKVPEMSAFFNKTIVTEEDRIAYHMFSWLTGNLYPLFLR